MKLIRIFTALFATALLGCDDKPATPAAPTTPPPAVDAKPPIDRLSDEAITAALAIKPEYAVEIKSSDSDPKKYKVVWSAKVNTGGWKMTTDQMLVEELNGAMACRIWVTLEQPNPNELVTQAMETLTGEHDAGTTEIGRVEFSVRRHIRGVDFAGPAMYAVVKTIKYPY